MRAVCWMKLDTDWSIDSCLCIAHLFPSAPWASGLDLSLLGAVEKQQMCFFKEQEPMPKPAQKITIENPGSCLLAWLRLQRWLVSPAGEMLTLTETFPKVPVLLRGDWGRETYWNRGRRWFCLLVVSLLGQNLRWLGNDFDHPTQHPGSNTQTLASHHNFGDFILLVRLKLFLRYRILL